MTGDVAAAGSRQARAQLGLPTSGEPDGGGTTTLNRLVTWAFVLSLCGIVIWGCAAVALALGLAARRWIADRGLPKRRMVTASIAISSVPVAVGSLALLTLAGYVAVT